MNTAPGLKAAVVTLAKTMVLIVFAICFVPVCHLEINWTAESSWHHTSSMEACYVFLW